MPDSKDKTNKSLASKHSKWERESEKIRKVQISLDFQDAADILLRTLAAREHKAPSSMIREIVGMPSSPSKRARIGVSFNDNELEELGRRYEIDPSDKAEIRRKLTEEVTSVLTRADSLEARSADVSTSTQNSQGDSVSKAKFLAQETEGGVIEELKSVSDSIHKRFKQALANRDSDK